MEVIITLDDDRHSPTFDALIGILYRPLNERNEYLNSSLTTHIASAQVQFAIKFRSFGYFPEISLEVTSRYSYIVNDAMPSTLGGRAWSLKCGIKSGVQHRQSLVHVKSESSSKIITNGTIKNLVDSYLISFLTGGFFFIFFYARGLCRPTGPGETPLRVLFSFIVSDKGVGGGLVRGGTLRI